MPASARNNLRRNIIYGAQKEVTLINRALQTLDSFEGLEERGFDEPLEAMEVFDFTPGQDVVQQG